MLNSCKNSVKILKIACVHAVTVANEGNLENAFLDQKTFFFLTGRSPQATHSNDIELVLVDLC